MVKRSQGYSDRVGIVYWKLCGRGLAVIVAAVCCHPVTANADEPQEQSNAAEEGRPWTPADSLGVEYYMLDIDTSLFSGPFFNSLTHRERSLYRINPNTGAAYHPEQRCFPAHPPFRAMGRCASMSMCATSPSDEGARRNGKLPTRQIPRKLS